jgi:hypothetical protein
MGSLVAGGGKQKDHISDEGGDKNLWSEIRHKSVRLWF